MTAISSLIRALGLRIALFGALYASACHHDSSVDFDPDLPNRSGAEAGSSAGTETAAGQNDGAAASSAGGKDGSGDGGKPTGGQSVGGKAGGAGEPSAGASGSAGMAGKAGAGGTATAGAGGKGAGGGQAGTAGGGQAGTGGTKPDPDPVTFTTRNIDDTHVASCEQKKNFGTVVDLNADADPACVLAILFNAPLGDIPKGSQITAATLTLTCINVGDPLTVSFVDEAWQELEVAWNSRPERGAALGTLTCTKLGEVSIDLKAAVTAWLSGQHDNYGIYLTTETTDGVDFDSSEAEPESLRPKLSITYVPPA